MKKLLIVAATVTLGLFSQAAPSKAADIIVPAMDTKAVEVDLILAMSHAGWNMTGAGRDHLSFTSAVGAHVTFSFARGTTETMISTASDGPISISGTLQELLTSAARLVASVP